MSESFGARLRLQRERHGIALPAIAGQTKIKLSLLEALERDDVSQWPSGIFRRAYVRSYAQAIGLDPDAVTAEFVKVHPDPAEDVTTDPIAAALDGARNKAAPPTRLRYIVGSALGSLTRFGRTPGATRQGQRQDAGSHTLPPGLETDLPVAVDSSPEPALMAVTEEALEAVSRETAVDVPLHTHDEEAPGHLAATAGAAWQEDERRQDDAGLAQEVEPRGNRESVEAPAMVEPGSSPGTPATDEDVREYVTPVVAEDTPSGVAPAPIEDVPPVPVPADPDLAALAALCTELGRAGSADAVQLALQQAASVLDARGLIVWLWGRWADGLRPALAHGYSDAVVAQLPIVGRDADNVTAAAFRSARPCATDGGPHASGALAVPLLTAGGCAGVLAIELEGGRAQMPAVRAAATILAAQLATLAGEPTRVEAEREAAMDNALMSR